MRPISAATAAPTSRSASPSSRRRRRARATARSLSRFTGRSIRASSGGTTASSSNAYVVTNDNSRTRVGFRGKAKISEDWEAGYRIEIGIRTANSKRFTQNNPEGNDNPDDIGFDMRDAYWFVKSKSLGQGSVGLQASATDQITEINLTQTQYFSKYSDQEDSGLGLFLRNPVTGGYSAVTWRRLIGEGGDQPGEGERRFNLVKYESPTWHGFTASASWGQDDFWDVALRYAGEFGGLQGRGWHRLRPGDGRHVKRKQSAPIPPCLQTRCRHGLQSGRRIDQRDP